MRCFEKRLALFTMRQRAKHQIPCTKLGEEPHWNTRMNSLCGMRLCPPPEYKHFYCLAVFKWAEKMWMTENPELVDLGKQTLVCFPRSEFQIQRSPIRYGPMTFRITWPSQHPSLKGLSKVYVNAVISISGVLWDCFKGKLVKKTLLFNFSLITHCSVAEAEF